MKYVIETAKLEWGKVYSLKNKKGDFAYQLHTNRLNIMSHSIFLAHGKSGQAIYSAADKQKTLMPEFIVKKEGNIKGIVKRKFSIAGTAFSLYGDLSIKGKPARNNFELLKSGVRIGTLSAEEGKIVIESDYDDNAMVVFLMALILILCDLNQF